MSKGSIAAWVAAALSTLVVVAFAQTAVPGGGGNSLDTITDLGSVAGTVIVVVLFLRFMNRFMKDIREEEANRRKDERLYQERVDEQNRIYREQREETLKQTVSEVTRAVDRHADVMMRAISVMDRTDAILTKVDRHLEAKT